MIGDDTSVKANILVAYPYLKVAQAQRVIEESADVVRLVVDSGAFTAWRSGKAIELDDYCRFLEGLKVPVWRYFTLDKIGDPHGTVENYQTMLKRGFNPVPIFTRGEDPSVMEEFYKTSDVVGVGGLVQTRGNKGFVNGIMEQVGKRRVHWLGFTDQPFIRLYRPYMADSSGWESGARFANIGLYMGQGRFKLLSRTDFAKRPDEKVIARIQALGVDPYAFRKADAWHGGPSPLRSLCAASGIAYSVDVQKNLGTLLFCAVTTGQGVGLLLDGFKNLQRTKVVK